MVSKEKMKQKLEKTAENLKQTVKKSGGKGRSKGVAPHRHCRICHVPIDLKRDPPICGDEECAKGNARNEKNEKMVRIAFFVFAAVFLLPIILKGFGVML